MIGESILCWAMLRFSHRGPTVQEYTGNMMVVITAAAYCHCYEYMSIYVL